MRLVDELIGFPRHLSQHVGGFVIARGKLSQLVPIENAAMAERTIIQWDKDDLDALGLLKVDVLALGMLSAIRRALDLVSAVRGKTMTHGGHSARRSGGVRHDRPRRYRGRVPDRIARADVHAAAHEAAPLLRPGDRGGHRAPGPDPGRHGASLSAPPPGPGAGELSERGCEECAGAHAGRADFPGTGDAARRGGGRLHAGRSRPGAALDGGVEAQGRAGAVRAAPDRRHARARLQGRHSRGRSSSRSWASANTAFPNRTPPASRCWSMSPPGSNATNRPPSPARCSTASPWASTPLRRSCRMRAATAWRCCRWT